MNRRSFFKTAGVGGIVFPSLLRFAHGSPNGRLQLACIGLGNKGIRDLDLFLEDKRVDVVALCDVDALRLDKARTRAPSAQGYSDWRELLVKESARLDAVHIATPDHMHAAIGLAAIQAGKHLYCQKPLCHDVTEVRTLTDAAAKQGVVTQLGTQLASGLGERRTVALLKQRILGEVRHVYLCENRANAVERYRLAGPRPRKGEAPPPELNWDLYLGTAPEREYAPDIYHLTRWRAWQDFGTGWLGDMGCHIFSPVWRGLGLRAPKSVHAVVQHSWKSSAKRFTDTWPQGEHVTWVFPGNKKTGDKDLTVEWFDGMWYPPAEVQDILGRPGRYPAQAAMIVGSEGAMLMPHAADPILLPREKFKGVTKPELEPRDHYRGFVDACLGKGKAIANFDITGPMTEAVLLGTVAIRVPDTTLQWDSQHLRIVNEDSANGHLQRSYRDGWQVPGLG